MAQSCTEITSALGVGLLQQDGKACWMGKKRAGIVLRESLTCLLVLPPFPVQRSSKSPKCSRAALPILDNPL